MIFDTDVLIWVTRGNLKAKNLVDGTADKRISAVTYMELMQGARNKAELAAIEKFLTDGNFKHYKCIENLKISVFKLEE